MAAAMGFEIQAPVNVLNMYRRLSAANPGPQATTRLEDATENLIRAAEDMIAQAREVQTSIRNKNAHQDQRLASLNTFSKDANNLLDNIQTVKDASEMYVMAQIVSFGRPPMPSMDVQPLLSQFCPDIKTIIRSFLDNRMAFLWEIVEECYIEAISDTGTLCYEPIRRENVSNGNANTNWIAFWRRALHNCPDGPTFFWPLHCFNARGELGKPPKYLFRAFDAGSCGKTDDTVVASRASIHLEPIMSRIDITMLENSTATRLLHAHLDFNPSFDTRADNLVSWSSSLLFVIQCAIWRCSKSETDWYDIKIIAVDTTRFPQGQFFKDVWLFNCLRSEQHGNARMQQLIKWRELGAYDNGEYLSQGKLMHQGRSCTTTLQELTNAGLLYLFPEFGELAGMAYWTKRVQEIRDAWSFEHEMEDGEVDVAFDIAKDCFPDLDSFDLALLLLCLKNRGYQMRESYEEHLQRVQKFCPIEVQRFVIATERICSRDELWCASGPDALKDFLECF